MALSSLIYLIFFAVFVIAECSSNYYPDLSVQNGSSCFERILFATSSDPFYTWVSSSYLALGFSAKDDNITNQQAGIAYKKLSVWRVAKNDINIGKGNITMLNSPEPHVMGGSFLYRSKNIAEMLVQWGLSIRRCGSDYSLIDDGPNMCRYTSQVIATQTKEDDRSIGFKVLFSTFKYKNNNGSSSQVKYLRNWVSHANAGIAVSEGEFNKVSYEYGHNHSVSWYYVSPKLTNCSTSLALGYLPDMVAYFNDSHPICSCVENVCVISTRNPDTELFTNATDCNTMNSYWVPIEEEDIWLYTSYSIKQKASYSIYCSLSPLDKMNQTTVEDMARFSSCFVRWLETANSKAEDSDELVRSMEGACPNYKFVYYDFIQKFNSNVQIPYPASVFDESVKEVVKSGDICPDTKVEKEDVCSAWYLSDNETNAIREIIKQISNLQEVKDYADKEWQVVISKLHNIYLDILTSVLAVFTTTAVVFSKRLMTTEKKVASIVKNAWRKVCGNEAEDGRQKEQKIENGHGKEQKLKDGSERGPLWIWFVRMGIRAVLLIGVMAECIIRVLESFKGLESEPKPGWNQTYQHRDEYVGFLITTTSTIRVSYIPSTLYWLAALLVPYFFIAMFFSRNDAWKSLQDDEPPKVRINPMSWVKEHGEEIGDHFANL